MLSENHTISASGELDSAHRPKGRKPRVIRVTEHVYSCTGYALSNVLCIVADKSVVVIDTTESVEAARSALTDFRQFVDLPASYIIYTHSHGDHIRGAKAFYTPGTCVVAQKTFLTELAKTNLLLPYRERRTAVQFGSALRKKDRGVSLHHGLTDGYVPPDIVFDEEYQISEGGIKLELAHTQGESLDHLMVWLPEQHVLFPGDLFYNSFPMLSSPMRPDRPVLAWAESLERMRALKPEYLVPSHGDPLSGVDLIDATLANYAKAIRHIHDETINCINRGLTLEETRSRVRLPEELAQLPYLRQRYGTVAWAVNSIYRQYTGWYDFNAAELNPGPRAARAQAILEACGSPAPLMNRARIALTQGDNQLALELADIVLMAKPHHHNARLLRAEALERLASTTTNVVEINIYRTAAKQLAGR